MGRKSARRWSRDAAVRTSASAAIPALLRTLGANPAGVLAGAGVDPAVFDDPDNVIPLASLGRLMKHCVAATGCQHFGLLVGQQSGLQRLGLVGLVVRYSPDVGTALSKLGSYMHLHNGGAIATVLAAGDATILSFDIHQPDVEAVEQMVDGAIAALFNAMRSLCGGEWQPIEVRFAHRRPDDVGPFRRFFRAPLHFDAEQTSVVFSSHWLDHRLAGADVELQQLLQQQIDALEARHGDEFPAQVRSVLRTGLLTGHGSAVQVAALFSIHSRTLRRRLGQFGTSFKALVDESRFDISRQMLRNTALDISQIAGSLDYADASAFTRAFRRWSGTTPAAWRAVSRPEDLVQPVGRRIGGAPRPKRSRRRPRTRPSP
jgi:AraC-like DNA-binding protein